jgi:hypothetical protein
MKSTHMLMLESRRHRRTGMTLIEAQTRMLSDKCKARATTTPAILATVPHDQVQRPKHHHMIAALAQLVATNLRGPPTVATTTPTSIGQITTQVLGSAEQATISHTRAPRTMITTHWE